MPITLTSVQELVRIVQKKLMNGVESITILLSSPGGQVSAGITAYNFLMGIPAEVVTFNTGQVDSIGVVLYCAGLKRYCSPNSRFLIHGIGFDAIQGQRFDERYLAERIEGLKNERITISEIISSNSKMSLEQVEGDMFKGVILTPQQAIKYGLVHEIKKALFEKGADVEQVTNFK